tara:strand:+ start:534 stop:1421 length:888 start_codon:yes stop_codon:yes gene_type:complete
MINHLAGIVPISGQKRVDYVFPWHDCLMPLSKDYYAIQRAVYECALVGCEVIWVVSDLEFQPLIKEIVGEWIMDPCSLDSPHRLRESFEHKRIPVHYLPIHPKDRDRRDCLSWSILYGANVANRIASKFSKLAITDKFWIAFPHGIYDPEKLRFLRKGSLNNTLKKKSSNFYLTYKDKSIINGTQAGFSMNQKQVATLTRNFKDMEVGDRYYEGSVRKRRPASESFTGRFFSLDKVFNKLYDGEEVEVFELPEYYQIDKFSEYRRMLGSSMELTKPSSISRFERKKREWRKMFLT